MGFFSTLGKGIDTVDRSLDVAVSVADKSLTVIDNAGDGVVSGSRIFKRGMAAAEEAANDYFDLSLPTLRAEMQMDAYEKAVESIKNCKKKGYPIEMAKMFYKQSADLVDMVYALKEEK